MTKEMLSDYRIVENINEYLVTLGTGQSLADSLDQFIAVGLLLLLAFSANFICRTVLLHVVTKLVKNTKVTWDDVLFDKKVLVNLSRMVAPVLIYVLLPVVFPREPDVVSFLQRLCMIYIIATFLRFINVFLLAIYHVYSEKEQFKDRPLKGLLQTAQVTLFFIGGIAIVSILMNKSPAVLLTGLGASAAILMLVFKDSIMGFVSGIQLSANNMLRVGDWIVMSKYGADGTVIEVTLNTVKVRNWDNTITTIPPYALVSDSFQNWRGMQESGGRRVKRFPSFIPSIRGQSAERALRPSLRWFSLAPSPAPGIMRRAPISRHPPGSGCAARCSHTSRTLQARPQARSGSRRAGPSPARRVR